jgi:hypothetical protein
VSLSPLSRTIEEGRQPRSRIIRRRDGTRGAGTADYVQLRDRESSDLPVIPSGQEPRADSQAQEDRNYAAISGHLFVKLFNEKISEKEKSKRIVKVNTVLSAQVYMYSDACLAE